MPKLIDLLLAEKKWRTDSFRLPAGLAESEALLRARSDHMRSLLAKSTAFAIDNVAQYYFANRTGPHGRMDEPDTFPNLAPPFACAFYEYTLEPAMYDVMFNEAEHRGRRCFDQVGVLIDSQDADIYRRQSAQWRELLQESSPNAHPAKWLQFASVFTRDSAERGVSAPCVLFIIAVNSEGQQTSHLRCRVWGVRDDCYDMLPETQETALSMLGRVAFPAFLANSFLHCKNVVTQQQTPPAKLSKAFQRRHSRPLFRYKTLAIEPMKEILRREGQVQTTGLKHALHLCRGHFKDYRNSGGLFGKYKGLFWWGQHARGDPEHGVVVKDYAIKLAN
jgi:hypothetical protein